MKSTMKITYSAWEDTKKWLQNHIIAYLLAFFVPGGGTVLATLVIPATMNITLAALYGFIGGMVGLLLMISITYATQCVLVVKKQRNDATNKVNELTQEVEKLTKNIEKLNEEHSKHIDEILMNDPIVLDAQKTHHEYVKTELEAFKQHFLEVNLSYRTYYRDYPYQDLDMIKSHFPDKEFWVKVEIFKQEALKFDNIIEDLEKEIRNKTELEVATQDETKNPHVTPNFWKTVIDIAIKPDTFHCYELIPQGNQVSQLWAGNFISVGIESEKKHREFINKYSKDTRIVNLALMLIELPMLREDIIKRIQRCIGDTEYIDYSCSRCPKQRVTHKGN